MAEGIAILGWGSLVWDEDEKFDWFNQLRTTWNDDGPELPLEFSRVSDSRSRALTLVIDPSNGTRCRVAYALSRRKMLAEAIEDLAKRESIPNRRSVGWLQIPAQGAATHRSAEFRAIEEWALGKNLAGVVWTALKSNFRKEARKPFNVANAVEYVGKLGEEARAKAKEYVEKAPKFIQVPTRAPLLAALKGQIEEPAPGPHSVRDSGGSADAGKEAPAVNEESARKDRRGLSLDEYQSKYLPLYEAFASTVRFILEQALQAADGLPRPQSIQSRAKSVASVRRRLTEMGKLDTKTLDMDRRDLAGARLIFYTNNDVDRFLDSPLVRDNFEIEEDSTKVHQPTPEKKGSRYRAIHYTVRLREDRIRLPEYQKYVGLRCEIQVQTILNHAWSETSHDIIYKTELGDGYGSRAMKGIKGRFERIMDDYLLPAGFEIQKAQQEYERLLQGKELFDKDIAILLDNAQNNNERYDILSKLKDYAIPYYDDLPAAYDGLKGPLLRAARAARSSEAVPIETTFGDMPGFKADVVVRLIVEIVESLRYADVTGTLQLLIDIFRGESDDRIRQQIINAVKHLAEYNLKAYNQVGPTLQLSLIDHLEKMKDADLDSVRPIALAVWTEALQSDITGTTWKSDSVVISTGTVPASAPLREVRDRAIKALFAAYDRSAIDTQRRDILAALDAATRTPHQGQYSNELLSITLQDAKRIVDFVAERAKSTSFELFQHLEHKFLYDYFHSKPLIEDPENRFQCQPQAKALVASILAFRDTINANPDFIKYKVLVGFESVYPGNWEQEHFDFRGADQYRRAEADRYINEIDASNESDWFALIERCAQTKSNDMATFPVFGDFIAKLSERKPDVADRLLTQASDDLRSFLPGFLTGLARSSNCEIYERVLENELAATKSLSSLARHLRYAGVSNADLAARLLKRSIEVESVPAVIECLVFTIQHYGTDKISAPDTFVHDALTFLNARKNPRWVFEGWALQTVDNFYEKLTSENAALLLENLSYVEKVDYHVEHVLARLADRWLEGVWDFFGSRLAKEIENDDAEESFEAVPFQFHDLNKPLSKDPQLAIKKGLAWFARDQRLFQFRGGRVLSNAFPNCSPEFAEALAEIVKGGGETEASFALAVLQNYHGQASTHVVLKEIVSLFSEDRRKMSAVRASIDSTGVVSGDLGFAEAWSLRKEQLAEWLKDERATVRAFAEKHIAEMERMIATEHRRAESDREMWDRDFEE